MDWIKNLKISNKLNLLIVMNLAFLLVLGLLGLGCIDKLAKDLNNMYSNCLIPTKNIGKLKENLASIDGWGLLMIIQKDMKKMQSYLPYIADIEKSTDAMIKEYEALPNLLPEEREAIPKLNEALTKYNDERKNIINLCLSQKKQEAFTRYDQIELNYWTEVDNLYAKLLKINVDRANAQNEAGKKLSALARTLMLTIGIIAFALAVFLGLMISNMITRPIQSAIRNLTDGSNEVSSASSQVAAASSKLAEGSSEQAAAIQETSATLEETSSMVQQSRENTQQAASLAKQTKQFAEKSNTEMGKMMISMDELKNSSNEIEKIIKVIDSIAFQTNILSLNAAVEAARAGDAGKGFAVVAEEVRNLAQRSAQAAKDTAVIIESNINLSMHGSEIAKNVQGSVESIDTQAKKVSELLDEISVATNEQAQGVEQINQAISQMEMVLSSNAQTAEESASASLALSNQATNVKEIVNSLIVLVDGAEALHNKAQNHFAIAGSSQKYLAG